MPRNTPQTPLRKHLRAWADDAPIIREKLETLLLQLGAFLLFLLGMYAFGKAHLGGPEPALPKPICTCKRSVAKNPQPTGPAALVAPKPEELQRQRSPQGILKPQFPS